MVHATYVRYFAKGKSSRATDSSPRRRAHTGACPQALAHRSNVSLDHGGGHVHVAIHRLPAESGNSVRLGHLSLDRGHRSDRSPSSFTSSMPHSFWTSGRSGRTGLTCATHGEESCGLGKAAPPPDKFAKYPAREQALPRRHHRRGPVFDRHRRVHDVSRAHHLFPPQSVSLQRHDLGTDVRACTGWQASA
jgi:hypothetical protein